MLSIGKMKAGQESYYAQLAREDYYLEGGEPLGQWVGAGAEKLSLFGQVQADLLREVFRGELDGKPLVQNAGSSKRVPGWDCCFSAPKTVSVAWSQADDATAQEIRAAHDAAVRRAIGYLEDKAGWTRRGHAGAEQERCSLVFATYEHGTSRAQDPQLHTHSLLLNIGIRADGTTGTLHTPKLYGHKMTAGALYRAELAKELRERLGLSAVKDGWTFKLAGVSDELTEEFSKRRAEIEAKLREQGGSGAEASERAALTTRTNKDHRSRGELMAEWKATGQRLGWSEKELGRLLNARQQMDAGHTEVAATLAAVQAFEKVTTNQTTFTEAQLTRFAAEEAQDEGLGIDAVLAAVGRMLADSQVVKLGQVDDEERYTSEEILRLEQDMLTRAERLKDLATFRVDLRHVEAASQSRTLTEQQGGALRYLTQDSGNVGLIVGDAGTGKTYMLDAARDAWQRAGRKVIGAALAGKAADGLQQDAGIESRTIASLLMRIDWEKNRAGPVRSPVLDKNTVLVVDEAGMVGTRHMQRLLQEASSAGAKVVLVGDAKQLQAIELGGSFAALDKQIGSYRLTEIMRQQDPEHAQAVGNLAEGRASESLDYYAKQGRLHVAEDRYQAREQMLDTWYDGGGAESPKAHLMLAGRNVDVKALNREAQDVRLANGALAGSGLEHDGHTFYRGDRVVITKTDRRALDVSNGQFGTVKKVNSMFGRVTIELDGKGGERTLDLEHFPHLKLGYAVTTHKAQGMTAEHAYVLTDETMQDRELSYVQLSRAKQGSHIFTTEEEAGEQLSTLARRFDRSRREETASEILERTYRRESEEVMTHKR